mgnify:CR=1 FL=1
MSLIHKKPIRDINMNVMKSNNDEIQSSTGFISQAVAEIIDNY